MKISDKSYSFLALASIISLQSVLFGDFMCKQITSNIFLICLRPHFSAMENKNEL